MSDRSIIILCPGQGAQAVGMGRAWVEASDEARAIFEEADRLVGNELGAPLLSQLCFEGPEDLLNRTNIAQPAIYTCSVACFRAWSALAPGPVPLAGAAGLSLGEYTALHLAGSFDFATGLKLVTRRGALMQAAAEASAGSMVALIGADEDQAQAICDAAAGDEVLVPANFNAPGQIVLSGHATACARAAAEALARGLRAAPLAVAGAFHSPLMQPAADAMGETLRQADLRAPYLPVWSNVTARPHDDHDRELLIQRLVEQIVSPVRWAQSVQDLPAGDTIEFHELAPGTVLRGLMRRIDRSRKVTNHDQPQTESHRQGS